MPRSTSRWRLWTLMDILAVAGVLLGVAIAGARLVHHAKDYRARAALHGRLTNLCGRMVGLFDSAFVREGDHYVESGALRSQGIKLVVHVFDLELAPGFNDPAWAGVDACARRLHDRGGWQRTARYHADLHEKYARAARYPWLPIPPDPPRPE